MSSFKYNGHNNQFATAEMNLLHRQDLSDQVELRLQAGGYYKELPETLGMAFSGPSNDTTIKAIGTHLGAELWYSLSPKFGVQANVHLYASALKVNTPNGQDLSPTLSNQLGFLGSYRFTPRITGLAGYARREDKMAYKVKNQSFASNGEINTATITGDYLNFFAEWSF